MEKYRAGFLFVAFGALTVPLMPVQYALLKLGSPWARTLPHWYHRQVCRVFGIRVHVTGAVRRDRPVLLVSNHISWLDIIVLSAVAPMSFIARHEVEAWPMVNWFAWLQRTVYVRRRVRTASKASALNIASRLRKGECLVLFPEGTTGPGHGVLPFKSSLLAAAVELAEGADEPPVVQTATIVYTHVNGLPLNRNQRPFIAWYGDMSMASHTWRFLKMGPLDVTIHIGEPICKERFVGRKQIAAEAERIVRRSYIETLTGRPLPAPALGGEPILQRASA
ncbi:MAG: lysophospholipid acyltransferase family protein [Hyphomicrobiales bacterium]|nr:lysophospholipid acyltransferase family protein [Hyphomicrobiales bacterium]